MSAITKINPKYFLGSSIPNARVYSSKIDAMIAKINELSISTNVVLAATITPVTTGTNITVSSGLSTSGGNVENHTASAINATATATAAQVATGYITSTSAAATAITLPTAANLLAALPGCKAGSSFELLVDNSAGANTVTVTASASITAATAVVTGGATLTVASGAVGIFKIVFTSATVAKIYRLG